MSQDKKIHIVDFKTQRTVIDKNKSFILNKPAIYIIYTPCFDIMIMDLSVQIYY